MGKTGEALSRAVEYGMLEGLFVFLTQRAQRRLKTVSPGEMGSKVASTRAHLVNASANETGKSCESVGSEASIEEVEGGRRVG